MERVRMIKIAIVENSEEDSTILGTFINRYSKENNVELELLNFENGVLFLKDYKSEYDIIFMDIDMPHMDGF